MTSPIRVLCVFSTLDRGGAESMCMNLYRHMDREKVQFDFVKHTPEKCAFDDEIESLGGHIYVAPRFKGYNLIQYQSWWRKHLEQHPEHQIIHGHYFTASKYYFSICKRLGRTTIGHCHTDTYTLKDPAKLIMIHGVEKLCDYRFACSEKAGKLLYPHKDFTVLKNAIDIDKYVFNPKIAEEVRKEFTLGDAFILGVVGTIKRVKNPLGMVEILNEVVKTIPNTKLLWAGGDGGMKQQVIEKITEYDLCDHVIFTGVRSDIPRILQAMDIYLMPSFSEGIPVSGIEAQAAGLPCLFSDTVSREVAVTDCCEFIPLNNLEAWKNCVVLAAQKERKDTIQGLRAAGYDIHTTATWLQEFYLNIV